MAVSAEWQKRRDLEQRIKASDDFKNAEKIAKQQVDQEAEDAYLLRQATNEERRSGVYNSKAAQEGRQKFDELNSKPTDKFSDTMQKYFKMIGQVTSNVLNGHSKINKVLNVLYDTIAAANHQLPNKVPPVKFFKPSEMLKIDENGAIAAKEGHPGTEKDVEIAKSLFQVHMASRGCSEEKDRKDGKSTGKFKSPVNLGEDIVDSVVMKRELANSDNNIKNAMGNKLEWGKAPENDDTPRPGVGSP